MKFQHLRSATAVLTLGEHQILIDPMLAEPGTLMAFKVARGRRKNPIVPLPPGTMAALEGVTAVLVTHEHPDHLDPAGVAWIEERGVPVWANAIDAPNLRRKGLDVRELVDGALGMAVEVVPSVHGRGFVGWMLGPVSGCYLAHPDEPSVYLTGDAVLTESVLDAVTRLRPDVVVAPAGAANFGFGSDILFSVDELVELVRSSDAEFVFNHLEAVDHCPTTRAGLRARMQSEGFETRIHVPEDGEAVCIERRAATPHALPAPATPAQPGFQKWLTAKFAGT